MVILFREVGIFIRRCTWLAITFGCFLSCVQVKIIFFIPIYLLLNFVLIPHLMLYNYMVCYKIRHALITSFLSIRHMLTIIDNEEFYEQEKPLSLKDIRCLIVILRQVSS